MCRSMVVSQRYVTAAASLTISSSAWRRRCAYGNLDGMGSPGRSRVRAAAVSVVLLLAAGCPSSSAHGSASARLVSPDDQWVPALNSDGDHDAIFLVG